MMFIIPGIAIPKDLIDIFNPSFLDITLSGRNTLISLNILTALKSRAVKVKDTT
jgi:hypothetical protein